MQTVIETPAFLASAKDEGVSEKERADIVEFVSKNPEAGEMIKGTGGARKLRVAGRGRGKSGGYRVITFFGGADMPVFLLDIYSKDSQANLSDADKNELRKILTDLPTVWRKQMEDRVRQKRR